MTYIRSRTRLLSERRDLSEAKYPLCLFLLPLALRNLLNARSDGAKASNGGFGIVGNEPVAHRSPIYENIACSETYSVLSLTLHHPTLLQNAPNIRDRVHITGEDRNFASCESVAKSHHVIFVFDKCSTTFFNRLPQNMKRLVFRVWSGRRSSHVHHWPPPGLR
jgi:hypothetical protein